MVDDEQTDTVLVCELFELTNDRIIAGIAVCFAAKLPDFLHRVDDNELRIGVFLDEIFKLVVQSLTDLVCGGCKVQFFTVLHAVHHEHPALDALKIIFKGEIEHGTLMDFIVPKPAACADMIGELRNQKRLSDFRRACENVRARVQQTVDDGRSAGVGGLVQFSHGNRVQMKRIACDADIFVDFFVRSGYTVFANFLR